MAKCQLLLYLQKERTEHYLRKEDVDGKLTSHLANLHAFNRLPLTRWFQCCYAGVLPDDAFPR